MVHPRSTPEAKTVPETRSCLVTVSRIFICSSMHRDQFGLVDPPWVIGMDGTEYMVQSSYMGIVWYDYCQTPIKVLQTEYITSIRPQDIRVINNMQSSIPCNIAWTFYTTSLSCGVCSRSIRTPLSVLSWPSHRTLVSG